MPSIDLTIGEADFGIEFELVDETTGSAFDLTLFGSNILLFIVSTDFQTQIVPGGINLNVVGIATDGVVEWNVQSSHIATPADQYYGIIKMTDSISGEIRKSRRFNIRTLESVSP